jgi:CelD/BcsL family acetyltransferase involved in cellulose biosynthesis
LKVEAHDRLEAVGAASWGQLHAGSRLRTPFLSFPWQREWIRVFLPGRRLELRTVKDADGKLVAALPLYEAEPGLFRLVGGVDVSDYLDLLALAGREEAAWTALLQARAHSRAIWDLRPVPAASPTVTAVAAIAGTCGLQALASIAERCPVLALPGSWEAYLDGLPSRHRHELTRKMRRLEREAPGARVTYAIGPDEIETRLGDFLDLHRRSRTGKARFMDARMEAFFRKIVVALAGAGGARLWFLDTAGGPIATFICLEWDETVGLYNSGFHPERAALAPGLVLLAHVLQDAIGRRKRRFDFLRGEERYKYEFGPTPEEVYAVRIEPSGVPAG